MRCLLLLAAVASTATALPAQTGADALAKAAGTIVAEDVVRHINVIAADSMMGRDTPSPGLEKTAQYVADQFKKFGLKPFGDHGTWFQRYPISDGDTTTAPNTVGILEGTDPKLKNEYVIFSAHMDHIGISSGQEPDSINNGADDDASGTVGILELAKAFSQPGARPKRSIIFLTVSGEEKGLLGSGYFANNPPVPLAQLVADIQFDVIGRGDSDSMVFVIAKEHSDLGPTFDRVNASHPELRLASIPNPPPEKMYNSDHYSFARRGVPVIKFGGAGSYSEIHTVNDSPDKIDAEREARIVRLAFYLGQDVANAAQRPQWRPESYTELVDQP